MARLSVLVLIHPQILEFLVDRLASDPRFLGSLTHLAPGLLEEDPEIGTFTILQEFLQIGQFLGRFESRNRGPCRERRGGRDAWSESEILGVEVLGLLEDG